MDKGPMATKCCTVLKLISISLAAVL